jgi:hypothetical protein
MIDPELLKDTAEQQGRHFDAEDMRTVAKVLLLKRREKQSQRIETDRQRLLTDGEDDEEDAE